MGYGENRRTRGQAVTIREDVLGDATADTGQFGTQDISGITEAVYKDDSGNGGKVTVLTKDGAINAAAVDHGGLGGLGDDDHPLAALVAGRAAENLTVQGNLIVGTIGPVAGQQHTLPAVASDTVALIAASQTLTTKTVNLANNTLTGTAAEFDTACSDDNFAFVSDNLSVFAATTSAQLLGVISDPTGTGLAVFGTSPTIATPNIDAGTVDSLTALSIRSTGAAFDLTIATATVFTAGRTLTIDPGDSARTLTLSGNPTLADWFDQSVKTTANPTFGNLTITSFAANWTNAGRTIADLGIVTTVDINGGTIDGVTIGGASAGAITGTTITANDLLLPSGAVINFNAGDVTITHSANVLTFTGGTSGYIFADAQNSPSVIQVNNVTSGIAARGTILVNGNTTQLELIATSPAFTLVGGVGPSQAVIACTSTDTLHLLSRSTNAMLFSTNTIVEMSLLSGGDLAHGTGEGGTVAATGNLFRAPDLSGGTDIAGADLTIGAGEGRGNGDVGKIIFQTPRVQASGSLAQTRATLMTLDEQLVTVTGNTSMNGDFDFTPTTTNEGELGTDSLKFKRIRATTIVADDYEFKGHGQDYTLFEAPEGLRLRNNKTEKTYRIKMEEINAV